MSFSPVKQVLKNLIKNPSAEVDTTGWTTYDDAASAPVDGTAGTVAATWTRNTTTPLNSLADFLLTKDAANRQGEGVAYDISVERKDAYSVLALEGYYKIASGTYSSGDVTLYVIGDPTGTPVVVQPAGYSLSNVSIAQRFQATFQNQGWTTIRVCIHIASTSASAYTIQFSDLYAGAQLKNLGVSIKAPTIQRLTSGTDATYTTPAGVKFIKVKMVGGGGGGSGSGTASASSNGSAGGNSFWKTLGGGTTIVTAGGGAGGTWGGGGSTGGTATINSPATSVVAAVGESGAGATYHGATGDFRIHGGAGGSSLLGGGVAYNYQSSVGATASANTGGGGQGGGGHNVNTLYSGQGGGAGGYAEFIIDSSSLASSYTYTVGALGAKGAAGTSGYAGGDGGSGIIIVEEYYHGDNIELSSQSAEGRVVALRATLAAAQTGVTDKVVPFDTAAVDTHSGLNLSTGVYTIKVPGIYRINACVMFGSSGTPQNDSIYIRKNTSNYSQAYASNITASTTSTFAEITDVLNLVAGDTIDIYVDGDASFDIDSNGRTRFNLERISGNQSILASESVYAAATNSAGTSISTGTWTDASWNAEVADSHGALGSTTFTAPISGAYLVAANASFATSAAGQRGIRIVQASTSRAEVLALPSSSYNLGWSVSTIVRMLAGDTVKVQVYQDSGGSLALTNSAAYNTFSVVRLGNY